jgi:tetratricopeptide (TPR) repeat protein
MHMLQTKSAATMLNGAHAIAEEIRRTEGPSYEALLLLAKARNDAYAEAARGDVGRGLTLLNDALMQVPSSHDLLSDMAALLLAAGEHKHAVIYASRALSITPTHGPSLYTLAFALIGQGETARAIQALKELAAPGPARDNLVQEAPDLVPLVEIELDRLQDR